MKSRLEPEGHCGEYTPNYNCSNHLVATAWAAAHCFGRHTCTLQKPDTLPETLATCPLSVYASKTVNAFSQRLTVQARCTGDKGIQTSAEYKGNDVYSLGFTSSDKSTRKLLLVNKLMTPLSIKLDVADIGAEGATAYIVDPQSVSRGASQGIREEQWKPYKSGSYVLVTLDAFAVAIATLNNNASASTSTVFV